MIENKLRILYVSSLWTGIKPLLFEGKEIPEGMPAFIKVLQRMLNNDCEVDFVFIGGRPRPLNIGPVWLKDSQVEQVTRSRGLYLPGQFGRQLRKQVRRVIKDRKPDFVYLHGFSASECAPLCRELSLPFGQRVYGVRNLHEKIKNYSNLYLRMKYSRKIEAFTGKKDFVIVTRDGSRGDLVCTMLQSRSKVPSYFVLNGVPLPNHETQTDWPTLELDDRPFLFYPSRFSKRKRNDLAIDFLRVLHERGFGEYRLVYAGQDSDPEMLRKTREKMVAYGLEEHVVFAGVLNANQMSACYAKCAAVVSLYSVANLGNITLEALANGCLLVSLRDESLNGVVQEGINGVLSDTVTGAANSFADLLGDPHKYDELRHSAREHAKHYLPSWQQRADWEISMIRAAVKRTPPPPCPPYAQLFSPGNHD